MKTTDRTKTTPEIHQQITIQAAQSGMTITNYVKMIVDNDKKRLDKEKGEYCESNSCTKNSVKRYNNE